MSHLCEQFRTYVSWLSMPSTLGAFAPSVGGFTSWTDPSHWGRLARGFDLRSAILGCILGRFPMSLQVFHLNIMVGNMCLLFFWSSIPARMITISYDLCPRRVHEDTRSIFLVLCLFDFNSSNQFSQYKFTDRQTTNALLFATFCYYHGIKPSLNLSLHVLARKCT